MRIQSETLKPTLRVEFAFIITCVISALLFAPHAWGQTTDKDKSKQKQTPLKFRGTLEFGGQLRDTQGSQFTDEDVGLIGQTVVGEIPCNKQQIRAFLYPGKNGAQPPFRVSGAVEIRERCHPDGGHGRTRFKS